jgi:hypothetical protein
MKAATYTAVCERTERKDEPVRLRNLKSGQLGYTIGCTMEGETVQVKLDNGEYDTWLPVDCEEV